MTEFRSGAQIATQTGSHDLECNSFIASWFRRCLNLFDGNWQHPVTVNSNLDTCGDVDALLLKMLEDRWAGNGPRRKAMET
jgi:hypothetical protein